MHLRKDINERGNRRQFREDGQKMKPEKADAPVPDELVKGAVEFHGIWAHF
jgi:hypothetical protein